MLKREELEQMPLPAGFTLWQKERDYLQHLFLFFLSQKIGKELIFKGGTALQKTLGLNRFSIDLDFTKNQDWPENLWEQLKKDFNGFGFATEIEVYSRQESQLIKFKIQGPLYQGTERTLAVLRIEISLREKVLLPAKTKEIFPQYPDLQPYLILVMDEREILAEKIRAILTRDKARDVFDLYFLFNKKVEFDSPLVKEKLKRYIPVFSREILWEAIQKRKKIWESELSQLISLVPPFEKIKTEVEGWLDKAFPK